MSGYVLIIVYLNLGARTRAWESPATPPCGGRSIRRYVWEPVPALSRRIIPEARRPVGIGNGPGRTAGCDAALPLASVETLADGLGHRRLEESGPHSPLATRSSFRSPEKPTVLPRILREDEAVQRRPWTAAEVRILAETAYFPVLLAQLRGMSVVKAEALRAAESKLPGRTHHTIKDRCYRISEVLRDEGFPWVRGWNPPDVVGQTPNSAGVTAVIREAVLPVVPREIRI